MSFLDTLKEIATVAVEAVKENPIAAAAIGGGVLVVGGGSIYAKRRYAAHKAAKAAKIDTAIAMVVAPEVAETPAEPTLLKPEFQQPARPQRQVS